MDFDRKQTLTMYESTGRVIVLYGPRRIGKTTLVRRYLDSFPKDTLTRYDIGDDISLQQLLGSGIRADILAYAEPYDVIAIDEAQNIPHIGLAAKMIIDAFPHKKIVLTGSSSFELAQGVGEPLTGRQYIAELFPLSWTELSGNNFDKRGKLEELLIYGMYPEVLLAPDRIQKEYKLHELVTSYLLRDILALNRIKSPQLLLDILRALAWQLGNEVSLHELARAVGESDHQKIGRYINLLEKSFIIKRLTAYSTNPRNEITSPVKYYFYDLGVRNALIGQLGALALRNGKDVGALWENFIVMESFKQSLHARRVFDTHYFWRNKKGLEVDLVRTNATGGILALECKWSATEAVFTDFIATYPKATTHVAHKENIPETIDYLNR